MTLYDILDKAMASQEVWIFEHNTYDQNMLLFKGEVYYARADQETLWDYLMCNVEYFDCSDNILDIRVKDEHYNKRLEDHYPRSDKWGKDKSERPWLYSMEIREEKMRGYHYYKVQRQEEERE